MKSMRGPPKALANEVIVHSCTRIDHQNQRPVPPCTAQHYSVTNCKQALRADCGLDNGMCCAPPKPRVLSSVRVNRSMCSQTSILACNPPQPTQPSPYAAHCAACTRRSCALVLTGDCCSSPTLRCRFSRSFCACISHQLLLLLLSGPTCARLLSSSSLSASF